MRQLYMFKVKPAKEVGGKSAKFNVRRKCAFIECSQSRAESCGIKTLTALLLCLIN
jgi:hypothetical protein